MMKLRQLVANSLPMGRSRKKKEKDKHQGAAKATSPSSVYKGNYHVPFLPKRHRSPVPAAPPKIPDNHYSNVKRNKTQKASFTDEELELLSEMRNIKMSDHTPTSPLSPVSPSFDKSIDYSLNFNLNTSDPKFSCYKHIHSTFSPKSDRLSDNRQSDRQSYDERLSTFVPHGRTFTPQRHSYTPERNDPPSYARHMRTPERELYPTDHYITSPTFSHRSQTKCLSITTETHYDDKPELHYSVSPALDSDINSNSLNRPRTRIKTNPWLPSPRGSSASSSSTPSPAYSPTDIYSPTAGKNFPQEAIYEEIPGCKDSDSPVHYNIKPSQWIGSTTSDGHSDTDSLQRSQVSESDNSLMSWSVDCPPSYERSLQINQLENKFQGLNIEYADDYKDPDILDQTYTKDNGKSITKDGLKDSVLDSLKDSAFDSLNDSLNIKESLNESLKDSENNDIDVDASSDTKSITSKVSFHYEEVFELKMEDDCDILSSNESLSDGYGSDDEDDVFLGSGACSLATSVSDVNSLDSASMSKVSAVVSDYEDNYEDILSDADVDVWQIRQDSSADTDDTICEYEGEYDLQSSMIMEPTPPRIRRFPRSSKTLSSSSGSPRSSTSKTLDDDSTTNEQLDHEITHMDGENYSQQYTGQYGGQYKDIDGENCNGDYNHIHQGNYDDNENSEPQSTQKLALSKLSDVSSLDSGADSGLYSMDSVSLDRSVGEVRSSLQDKVTKLRQDKLLVDEKIRQAQEEDRIRTQEKMRFQKQLTQHRKQMLLNTLQDLKAKLENQSQRLQSTYSSVLHMQKHMIRQRKHMSAHEISAADANEAPF